MSFYATDGERLQALVDRCESPIETLLANNLATLLFPSAQTVHIIAQWPLERFRYDFLVNGTRYGPLLLIECDGKEFHSTKAQIANDRRKDAAARAAGIAMIRFSGSEIFGDPMHCAQVVVNLTARELAQAALRQ